MKTFPRCALVLFSLVLLLSVSLHPVSADIFDVWDEGVPTQGFTPDGSGGIFTYAIETKQVSGQTRFTLKANKISPAGQPIWGTGVTVLESTTPLTHLRGLMDSQGGLFLVFSRHTEGEENADMILQRLDANGDLLWGAQGLVYTGLIFHGDDSSLVSDGSDGLIVVWRRWYEKLNSLGNFNLLAQHFDGNGQPTWGAPYLAVALNSYHDSFFLRGALSDGNGGVVAVYGSVDSQYSSLVTIEVQRVNETGNLVWGSSGKLVAGGEINSVRMAPDGGGGVFLIWREGNDRFKWDLMGQYMTPEGSNWWAYQGSVLAPDIYGAGANDLSLTFIDPDSYLIAFSWPSCGYCAGSFHLENYWEWEPDLVPIGWANGTLRPVYIADGAGGATLIFQDDAKNAAYILPIPNSGEVDWTKKQDITAFLPEDAPFYAIRDGVGGILVSQNGLTRRLKDDPSPPTLLVTGNGLSETSEETNWVSSSTVNVTTTDPESSITSHFKYSAYNHEWPDAAASPFTSGHAFTSTGLYQLTFDVTNAAGMGNSLTRYLKIDTTAPTLALTGSGLSSTTAGTDWVNQSTITFTAIDAHSGVESQVLHFSRSLTAWPTASTTTFNNQQTFTLSGYYRFEVQATDALGNSASLVRYLKIDNGSLTVHTYGDGLAAEQPDAHWVASSEVGFDIEASISGLESYSARYGRLTSSWPSTAGTDFTLNPEVFTENGYYRIDVGAQDGAGRSTSVTRFLKIDSTPPTAQLTGSGLAESVGAATWQGSSSVGISMADPVSGMALTASSYGYSPTGWPGNTNQVMTNGQVFNNTGYYRLKLHVVDYAGNSTTLTRYLKIDASPPDIHIDAMGLNRTPDLAEWVSPAAVTFEAADEESGVANLQGVYAYSASGWPGQHASTTPFASGKIFDLTGYYRLDVSATDGLGNQSSIRQWLKVDATAPLVIVEGKGLTETRPLSQWTKGATIKYSWSDAHSGLLQTEAMYGYAPSDWPLAAKQPLENGARLSANGYYQLEIDVYDVAGNCSHLTRYLKVDGSPPILSLSGSGLSATQAGAKWVNQSTLSYRVQDAPAGIQTQSLRFSYNQTAWPTRSLTHFDSGQLFYQSGYYRIEALAEDLAGNRTHFVRWLKIDSSLASIEIEGDGLANESAQTSWVKDSTVTYSITGTGASILTARYGYNPAAWPATSTQDFSSGQTLDATGYYRFEITASSAHGNLTEVRYLKIDATDPLLVVTGAGLSVSQVDVPIVSRVMLSIAMDDAHSGVVDFDLRYSSQPDSFPGKAETPNPNDFVFDQPGYYMLVAQATDGADNTTSLLRWFRINTMALTADLVGAGLAAAPGESIPVSGTTVTFLVAGTTARLESASYDYSAQGWHEESTRDLYDGQGFSMPGYYRAEITARNRAGQQITTVRWFQIKPPPGAQLSPRLYLPLAVH